MHFPELVSQATVWHDSAWQTIGVKTQFPFEQESVVHALLSLHTLSVYWHPRTTSQDPILHLFPLSQVIGVCWIPFWQSQVSVVQALLSLS